MLTRFHLTRPVFSGLFALASACSAGSNRGFQEDSALADTLKARIEAAYDFTKPGIVDRMNGLYPDSGRVISASDGHIVASVDSLKQGIADFWKNVGHNMKNPKWVWGNVFVDRVGPDAAVLTATWAIPHIAPTNHPHTIQGAWTAVFRRMNGKWMIVTEHLSVPPPQPGDSVMDMSHDSTGAH